jgi:aminoglycoside 6'-N-acetyltransferase
MQIIDRLLEDSHYWGEVSPNLGAIDIWIGEADDLRKRYCTEMMKQAIDRCLASPELAAINIDPLDANVRARKFYEKRTFDEDFCAVY